MYKMPKRCPNGTRRNKTSKKCEPKSGSKTRPKQSPKKSKTMRKCSKGVSMPPHRIENIMKFEKSISSDIEPEYFERMEKRLNELCFARDTNWSKIGSYIVAVHHSIKK